MNVEVKVNVEDILERTKEFGKEFEELCSKYGLAPGVANDEETNEVFFVVNVKDLIDKKDMEINLVK